jgi:hypothetical protein
MMDMAASRRHALLGLLSLAALPGCAPKYARFRAEPGPDWSYLVASTAIERPSPLRIVTCSLGGSMVGSPDDRFSLKTDIAPISRQKLDIDTPELAMSVGVQPLPPGRYVFNEIAFFANATQSWQLLRQTDPLVVDLPPRSGYYFGAVTATRELRIRVTSERERDMKLALGQRPTLAQLPLVERTRAIT